MVFTPCGMFFDCGRKTPCQNRPVGITAPLSAVPPWPHVLTVQLTHVGLAGCNHQHRFRILLKRINLNPETIIS